MQKAAFVKVFALTLLVLITLLFSIVLPSSAATVGGVQGTINDEVGKAVPGAQVILQGGGAPQQARSDGSGYFSFAGVQPGSYTLNVNVVTYNSSGQTITVVQDITSTIDFSLTKKVRSFSGSVRLSHIRANDPAENTPLTARDEQREKSQPNALYQTPGLLYYKPGVVVDAGQYPHLRGSDGNQILWSMDGVDLRDPISHQFATNLVTVGVRTSDVITGGVTADFGGATGGYLNQISVSGRDLAHLNTNGTYSPGGFIEETNGPAHKWQYSGGNLEVGGVLDHNKLDYAFSSIVFKTHYGDNTQLGALNSSHDESAKFNYYADPKDQFTFYFSHGEESYNTYDTAQNSIFFDPNRTLTASDGTKYYSSRDLGKNFNDHYIQTYNLDHFTYKRNFTPSSYLQYRIYQLHQGIPYHLEGTAGGYIFSRTNVTGNQFSYFNQLNRLNILRAGLQYLDSKGSYQRQVFGVNSPLTTGNSYIDFVNAAYPQDFALYLADQLRSQDSKLTFDYGLRYNSTKINLQDSKASDLAGQHARAYTTTSTDPHLGLAYTPNRDLTFRTSYTIDSQTPDEGILQTVSPSDVGAVGTNLTGNPLDQSTLDYHLYGVNRINLSHSKNFDLGMDKAFNFSKGPAAGLYTVSLSGYTKWLYDQTYQQRANYDPNAASTYPHLYDNEGRGHASGFEVSFHKVQQHPSDWNGYINYTNQVVRASSSYFDTRYAPYFSYYEAGNPYFADSATTPGTPANRDLRALNRLEFPTGWDQRHTVGVVIGKRFSKLLESTFVLDAGSGLPFYSAATSEGSFVNGASVNSVGPGFADVHRSTGGPAEFTEVPISLGGNLLPPVNPVVGYTGWHYKIAINTNFYLTKDFSLFLNCDNVFDAKTALTLATGSYAGNAYWIPPSPQYPQGQEVYRYLSKLTPVILTFGFRQRF